MSSTSVNYASLPRELKRIGDNALGRGVLPSVFQYHNSYELTVKISDGEHIGFSLYHVKESTLKNGEPYRTGVIDVVCVAPQFRGDGFGTQLMISTLQTLSKRNVNRVELLVKRPSEEDLDTMPGIPGFGSDRLLRALGFRKVQSYPKHFYNLSKQFGYDCITCGETPDNCDGILYAINDRDHIILPS